MVVVGITGGLSTGKSTVAEMFKAKGAIVLSADKIAHECMRSGGKCVSPIVKVFGKKVYHKGGIHRRKLAQLVFRSKTKLRKLEALIHPEVKKVFQRRISELREKKSTKILMLEVPLLFEVGMDKLVEVIIVVHASRHRQVKRAVKKLNISEEESVKRIQAQIPLKKKIKWADFVIDNNDTKIHLRKKVTYIWEKLQQKQRT
jgi:dephospho-CoA kinase